MNPKGRVLVVGGDAELIARAEEAQSAWEGAVAELQASGAELQNNILNQEVVVTQAQLNLEKAQLKAKDDKLVVVTREGYYATD